MAYQVGASAENVDRCQQLMKTSAAGKGYVWRCSHHFRVWCLTVMHCLWQLLGGWMSWRIGQTSVTKAIDLLHIANTFFGKMDTWGGAIGELCHRVPHAPSGRNTPVLMGYIQDLDTFNIWLINENWLLNNEYLLIINHWSENLDLLFFTISAVSPGWVCAMVACMFIGWLSGKRMVRFRVMVDCFRCSNIAAINSGMYL